MEKITHDRIPAEMKAHFTVILRLQQRKKESISNFFQIQSHNENSSSSSDIHDYQ